MKYKVRDKARAIVSDPRISNTIVTITDAFFDKDMDIQYYITQDTNGEKWGFSEDELEPIVPTFSEVKDGKIDCIVHAQTQEEANILCEELGTDSGWHRPANECWQYYNKDTWYIIQNGLVHQFGDEDCRLAYPSMPTCEFSDLFATGGVCTGFRGGKIPTPSEPVSIEEQLRLPIRLNIKPPTAAETQEQIERITREILKFANAFPKEEKKMPTKFTFYVKEGTRPDKKCNGTIPTMTTTVVDASGKKATVTCDKADYNERQGVLEAIAQMACGGNFDKEYGKAVKKNKLIELHDRTCTYCGKVFDTIAEREEHEAWHVECRKARHERYLLRKRAKEIAFEEQAQKMAKEMMDAEKGAK